MSGNNDHLYKTARWHRMRGHQLKHFPMCKFCADLGHVTAATIADHIRPHKGSRELFFDPDNLQSLCKHCHDSHKQSQDRTGALRGNNTQGYPLDPNHHWNN